ncbi:MAG: dephospho-CoA kinase [Candidatus Omnitrophica bacterium]|nr:dephospho-CoA kinase [Candidatus Omnitrophota bacterium]
MSASRSVDKVIVGVTGSFGSGKSVVCAMMKELGAHVIDADRLAHLCLREDHPAYAEIVKRFGKKVVTRDGRLSRRKLAGVIFSDGRARRALNKIVHPRVVRMMRDEIARAREEVVVCDVPLLLEAGLEGMVDMVVVVKAKEGIQVARLRRRSGLSDEEIRERIGAQMPLADKERLADFIIDNSYSRVQTRKQVERLWKKIRHRKKIQAKRQ